MTTAVMVSSAEAVIQADFNPDQMSYCTVLSSVHHPPVIITSGSHAQTPQFLNMEEDDQRIYQIVIRMVLALYSSSHIP